MIITIFCIIIFTIIRVSLLSFIFYLLLGYLVFIYYCYLLLTVIPVKPWTPEKIYGMLIVSRPIRSEMKPQKITANSHDLIRNNKLAFSSRTGFFFATNLQKPYYRFRNIELEAKFTTVQVFLLSYQKIRIENHQSQPTSMTLWTAREAHRSAPLLIGSVFFFSDARSSLVWSYLLDSTSLSRKYVTKHIIHIYSLHINKLKYKKNNVSIWKP